MLKNLYFFKGYNDYFNREIKYYPTLKEYTDSIEDYTVIQNVNLDINDNVNATIVVPEDDPSAGVSNGIWKHGTYMIAQDTVDTTDLSRWFVVEAEFIRQGRYKLTLRRDLVSDFLEPLLKSTVYVEKGYVRNNTLDINDYNPLAFNQEGFTANQIKKKEVSLKDKAGCKWVVGYLNKGSITEQKAIKAYANLSETPDYKVSTISASPVAKFVDNTTLASIPKSYVKAVVAQIDIQWNTELAPGIFYRRHAIGKTGNTITNITRDEYRGWVACNNVPKLAKSLSSTEYGAPKTNYQDIIKSFTEARASIAVTQEEWNAALAANDKILYVSTLDKYFRIKVYSNERYARYYDIDPNTDAGNYSQLEYYVTHGTSPCYITTASSSNFHLFVDWASELTVSLTEIQNQGYSLTVKPDYNKTIGEAYDAFAIPLLEDYYHLTDGNVGYFSADYNSALAIGQELTDINTEALDLQLLPYAPIPDEWISTYTVQAKDIFSNNGDIPDSYLNKEIIEFNLTEGSLDNSFNFIFEEDGRTGVNIIFYLDSTQFNKIIEFNGISTGEENEDLAIANSTNFSSIEQVKCRNQLDTWRIYAGDYSSSFEFNMARNGGVAYFEVDCAYKPYHPYIRVAPNFGGLYGSDFNDTRGLVCSNTDYSLPRISAPWETYERTNINYMNAFNRQIQNMDVNRKYQRKSEVAQMIAGSITAGGTGAFMGSALPIPGATAIGAAVGGAASLGAGLQDLYYSDQLYKENKQYAIDQFNMNLENIQALPNTITAVGALNPNNKVFPQLTFYSCSDIEREAFLLKMKWDGMTIGILTNKISDYVNINDKTYFKGRLVYMPLEEVNIESHELAELANELAKGILIDKGVIQ